MKKLELLGQKINMLTEVEYAGTDKNQNSTWRCICECGNEIIAVGKQIKIGNTKSCGCYKILGIVSRSLKHGHQRQCNRTPEYMAWRHMKSRCYNANVHNYNNYG